MKKIFLITVILVFLFIIINSIISLEKDEIKIHISEISDKARWYEYEKDGIKIKFFVVKASDGSIKTAFDACDICYKNKMGYRQEGDYIVCNNCGNKYLIDDLGIKNIKSGGCLPGFLPNIVKDDNVLIKKSDIEKGVWRFK